MINLRRRGPRRNWTAADYDSYEVLAAANIPAPAVQVTRARRSRPVRRARRAALRTVRSCCGLARPTSDPRQNPAN